MYCILLSYCQTSQPLFGVWIGRERVLKPQYCNGKNENCRFVNKTKNKTKELPWPLSGGWVVASMITNGLLAVISVLLLPTETQDAKLLLYCTMLVEILYVCLLTFMHSQSPYMCVRTVSHSLFYIHIYFPYKIKLI